MQSGLIVSHKYRLNNLLGTGGMAEVWSATNVLTDRMFAIKFMSPEVGKSKEAGTRFLKEAKVSARINHPNVIDVIDIGQTEDGRLFMVMELLTGDSLETALHHQRPRMTVHDFVFVMIEVARALAAAHRVGVIHRDLKPTNILLHKDKNGAVVPKLLDFGVSKFLEDGHESALTMAGTVLGSPLYMSPEQARGEVAIDQRSDIFAFGAIMFEALSGGRPFDAPSFNALIVNIATKPPRDIDVCAPQMPESLREVVKLCLETDRERRAPNLDAVSAMLVAALPALANLPLRLPAQRQASGRPNANPDATRAMPMMRASDSPHAIAASPLPSVVSLSNSAPPEGYANPWSSLQTPSLGATTFSRKKERALMWGLAGGATILVLLVVAITTIALKTRGNAAFASSPGSVSQGVPQVSTMNAKSAVTGTPNASNTGASSAGASYPSAPNSGRSGESRASDPPSVSIDALPVATPPPAPVAKGFGRLYIASTSGWCAISIDGIKKGPTPLPAVDVSAGTHTIRCEPQNGKPTQVTTVVVQDGQTARYSFKVE